MLSLYSQKCIRSAVQIPIDTTGSVNQGEETTQYSDGTSAGRCEHALVSEAGRSTFDRSTVGGPVSRPGPPCPIPLTAWDPTASRRKTAPDAGETQARA